MVLRAKEPFGAGVGAPLWSSRFPWGQAGSRQGPAAASNGTGATRKFSTDTSHQPACPGDWSGGGFGSQETGGREGSYQATNESTPSQRPSPPSPEPRPSSLHPIFVKTAGCDEVGPSRPQAYPRPWLPAHFRRPPAPERSSLYIALSRRRSSTRAPRASRRSCHPCRHRRRRVAWPPAVPFPRRGYPAPSPPPPPAPHPTPLFPSSQRRSFSGPRMCLSRDH